MRDKNKEIHLWLLEQEREKNRARSIQIRRNSVVPSPSTTFESLANPEKVCKDETTLSPSEKTNDVGHLLTVKSKLEELSERTNEHQEKLKLQERQLLEDSIQLRKERIGENLQEINLLLSKIDRLKTQVDLLERLDDVVIFRLSRSGDKRDQFGCFLP